ncbi:MAG: hypothetical protein IPK31_00705 [Chitinophagaceae bacterium]|nr:hypothetical protein [Chitinophagaceae bacterium]
MKNKLIVIGFVLLMGCNNSKSINNIGDYQTLAKGIKEGDLNSYSKMKILCLDYKPTEIIKWAKFAADSINYKPANLDVFEAYLDSYYIFEDTIDLKVFSDVDRKDVLIYYQKAKFNKVQGVEKYFLISK